MNKELIILTLTTTPNRLMESKIGWGVRPSIENLLNLSYVNYEIHFNIPFINKKSKQEYIIPEWLSDYEKNNEKLKIFRTEDYGSITKLVPTIERIINTEQILITVDDDLIYHDDFIEYHLLKRKEYEDYAIGFAGIGSINGDCHFCTTLEKDTRVKILEGYKTISYKRKFFEDDFKDFVIGFWNDDMIISAYLGMKNIKKISVSYDKDTIFNPIVESYPIIKHISNEHDGCWWFRNENIPDNHEKYYKLGYLER